MGIPGLTSYITQRQKHCLKNFQLQDTLLVVDGNAFIATLYRANNCSYCFGGEYGEYAFYVSEFFDELLKCNVTPIIIIDGAMEDRKLSTIYSRSKQRIEGASVSTPSNQQQILPLLTKDVFMYIVRQKNIKCVIPLYEADDHIASIARILNCPVLSNDSDFFIFDVMYIPIDTLNQGIMTTSNGNGFFKQCKMFKSEYLLETFGMDKSLLPLIPALLGNDYVKINIFKNFFSSLKVSRTLKENFHGPKLHLRIEALFRWIKTYTLDEAVARILSKIDPEKRDSILEVIEMVINGYLNLLPELLGPLGYSSEEIGALMQKISKVSYKFHNFNDIEIIDEAEADDDTDLSCDDGDLNPFSLSEDKDSDIVIQNSDSNLSKLVPSWFMKRFNTGYFPSFFMDMIHRQLIVVSEQMEDFRYPTSVNISLKILSVIFRLLNNGTTNCKTLKYITRGNGTDIMTYELNCEDFDIGCEIPTLQELINFPSVNRKSILLNTLGIADRFIVQFPPLWRMYIAGIKYWLVEADKSFTTKYHLYTLIFLIIFHVIRKVIKCQSYFEMNPLKGNHKNNSNSHINVHLSVTMPVKEALENIKKDDCIFAQRFFISKMGVDRRHFDISIVHAFTLFLNCLRASIHLNALLGNPYPHTNVAEFFTGTLIYNIYNDLKKHEVLNQRVRDIFKKSPSVLQLFVSISTTIEAMLR